LERANIVVDERGIHNRGPGEKPASKK
jgi:hypothetical protein